MTSFNIMNMHLSSTKIDRANQRLIDSNSSLDHAVILKTCPATSKMDEVIAEGELEHDLENLYVRVCVCVCVLGKCNVRVGRSLDSRP